MLLDAHSCRVCAVSSLSWHKAQVFASAAIWDCDPGACLTSQAPQPADGWRSWQGGQWEYTGPWPSFYMSQPAWQDSEK